MHEKIIPSLKGIKIIVDANDLEQLEHRGIAMYSKNLIYSLKRLGAEVWILVGTNIDNFNSKNNHINEKDKLEVLSIIGDLSDIKVPKELSIKNGLKRGKDFGNFFNKLKSFYGIIFIILKLIFRIKYRKISYFHRSTFYENPLLKTQRLSYLNYIDGLVFAKGFHSELSVAQIIGLPAPIINLKKFDFIITTSPLCISSKGRIKTIQTILDLIPIQMPHPTNPKIFRRRLIHTFKSNKNIFISQYTQSEYNKFFIERIRNLATRQKQYNLTLPPTLKIDEKIKNLLISENFKNIEDEKIKKLIEKEKFYFEDKVIYSNKYILFNSSIEPRKNIETAIDSFMNFKEKEPNEFKICIVGKLNETDYCQNLKRKYLNPDVVFTDFVNEEIKALLFLNARGFISPSFMEGFGIPVLESALMGLPSLVSDIKPHEEIYNIKDFKKFIKLIPLNNNDIWQDQIAEIFMNSTFNVLSYEAKFYRLKRFVLIHREILNKFDTDLCQILTS